MCDETRPADAFALVVPMKPASKERRSRRYSSPNNIKNEARIKDAWIELGKPRLPEGQFALRVFAYWERSAGHFRSDGVTLGASGERATPGALQDWDNVGKLAADALNSLAYRDDRYCIDGRVVKGFAGGGRIIVAVAAAPLAFGADEAVALLDDQADLRLGAGWVRWTN